MTNQLILLLLVYCLKFLRGQKYDPQALVREKRAALKLLNLQPALSLLDIEESWRHGSDDYWRETHGGDNLHVHDLVNTNSHGKYRVFAFLEHKRTQKRRNACSRQQQQISSPPPPLVQQQALPTMTESDAYQLVHLIQQTAEAGEHTHLHGSIKQDGDGWIVHVSWLSSGWKGDLGLDIRSIEQWQHEFSEWNEVIQLRSAKRRGA